MATPDDLGRATPAVPTGSRRSARGYRMLQLFPAIRLTGDRPRPNLWSASGAFPEEGSPPPSSPPDAFFVDPPGGPARAARFRLWRAHGTSTIFPCAPDAITCSCALAASASGN